MIKRPRVSVTKVFVNKLYKFFRCKTVLTDNTPTDEFMELLENKHISYGTVNGIVDVLILDTHSHFDVKPRWILSKKEVTDKDFVFVDKFFDYGLYKRKNLIVIQVFLVQEKGAVGWYRLILPMLVMWKKYEDIDVRLSFPMNFYDLHFADIVIFQRYLQGMYGMMRYAKSLGKKVIYETDDNDIYINPENPLYWEYRVSGKKEEIINCASIADYVTVSTNKLREELLVYNSNVKVFRNKIDLSEKQWNLPKQNHNDVIIGWAGGSTHYYDLQIVRKFIQQICNRFNNVKFMLCGYSKGGVKYNFVEDKETGLMRIEKQILERGVWDELADEFRKEINDKLLVMESLPLDRYGEFYSKFDICVIPLNDNRFNRSKSELKVIEAGAYSLPVVASDVGVHKEVIKNGVNGFLAKDTKDWIKYLSKLIYDKDLRERIGKNLREYVVKNYDANDQEDRYKFYRTVFDSKFFPQKSE